VRAKLAAAAHGASTRLLTRPCRARTKRPGLRVGAEERFSVSACLHNTATAWTGAHRHMAAMHAEAPPRARVVPEQIRRSTAARIIPPFRARMRRRSMPEMLQRCCKRSHRTAEDFRILTVNDGPNAQR